MESAVSMTSSVSSYTSRPETVNGRDPSDKPIWHTSGCINEGFEGDVIGDSTFTQSRPFEYNEDEDDNDKGIDYNNNNLPFKTNYDVKEQVHLGFRTSESTHQSQKNVSEIDKRGTDVPIPSTKIPETRAKDSRERTLYVKSIADIIHTLETTPVNVLALRDILRNGDIVRVKVVTSTPSNVEKQKVSSLEKEGSSGSGSVSDTQFERSGDELVNDAKLEASGNGYIRSTQLEVSPGDETLGDTQLTISEGGSERFIQHDGEHHLCGPSQQQSPSSQHDDERDSRIKLEEKSVPELASLRPHGDSSIVLTVTRL